jgi:hypothetical protein
VTSSKGQAVQRSDLLEGLSSFGDHAQDEVEFRARVAAWLESHEGLRSSGKTAAEYEAMMFPHDTEAFRRSAADTMWSCALRFLAVLRHLGVPHAILDEPYERRWKKGGAVIDAGNVARAFGALCEYGALASYEPQAGDALCSQGPSGPHVSCVTKATWEPGARLVLECVDGGQGHKGDMAVERNVYLLDRRAEGPALRNVENRSLDDPGPPMRLVWGVDIWKLVLAAGLLKA